MCTIDDEQNDLCKIEFNMLKKNRSQSPENGNVRIQRK